MLFCKSEVPISNRACLVVLNFIYLFGALFSIINSSFLRCNADFTMSELAECMQTDTDALASSRWRSVAISTDCLRAHSRITRPFAWCEHESYSIGASQASSKDGGKAHRICTSLQRRAGRLSTAYASASGCYDYMPCW